MTETTLEVEGASSARADFLVHSATDTVGVVIVEKPTAGQDLVGWMMESDQTIVLRAIDDIPLGHKIALISMSAGDTVVKYSHPIGVCSSTVKAGEHVHIHNLKSKLW